MAYKVADIITELLHSTGVRRVYGPCPTIGQAHRCVITLYALKGKTLPVSADATPVMVRCVLTDFILAKAVLSATYAR
jgi:phosphatidylethanolamine-binding protein (PEBP) family uncharacterized protein